MNEQTDIGVDNVNHPAHYTNHPSGVECIDIAQNMGFCVGNAWKYLHRAELKGKKQEDLKKALAYMYREFTHPFYTNETTYRTGKWEMDQFFLEKLARYAEHYAPGQAELMAYVTDGNTTDLLEAMHEVRKVLDGEV